MSDYQKIALLSTKPFFASKPNNEGACISEMISIWKREYEKVLCDNPDIIIIPEESDRFENMTVNQQKSYYELRADTLLNLHKQIAKENQCYIAVSSIRKADDGIWRNTTSIIDRQGMIIGNYYKNHILQSENDFYNVRCGNNALSVTSDFGNISPIICFDLNFDDIREKVKKSKPRLITFHSMFHGGLLQEYWALNCRAYFAAAVKNGQSRILSPLGQTIAFTTNYYDYSCADVNFDYSVVHLDGNKEKLLLAKQKYSTKIKISDPGHLGAVLLTSEDEYLTSNDIIQEFSIETIDDYFNRCNTERIQLLTDENNQ